MLKEKLLADKVAGVLVEFEDKAIASTPTNGAIFFLTTHGALHILLLLKSLNDIKCPPSGFSADTTYPQAEFSLHDTSYVWNPTVRLCFLQLRSRFGQF